MTGSVSKNFPIDAVITWVDGADPEHAQKLNAYLATLGEVRPRAANPIRFHHSGELDYCVTSLLRFAPWIRTIYIVTDNQVPTIINRLKGTEYEGRVVLVDHRVIFAGFEQYLPTFNSSSILAVLWRIPGLAEHFIFLNDDFALIQPVKPDDFFREGKVVLRGSWRAFAESGWRKRVRRWFKEVLMRNKPSEQRAGYLAGQELSATAVGFEKKYFQIPHNPHAWRVSTFKKFFADNPALMEFSVSFRLRSPEQFIIEGLAAHLELKAGSAVVDNQLTTLQLKPADQAFIRIKNKIGVADNDVRTAFICIQSIEKAPESTQSFIFSWLDKRIGGV
jgi:hypothetical protein